MISHNIHKTHTILQIHTLFYLIFFLHQMETTLIRSEAVQVITKPQAQEILNIESTIPSHLYSIYVEEGHRLIGEMGCLQGQANMDIFIHKSLNTTVQPTIGQIVSSSISQQNCHESILFYAQKTDIYYIRIIGKDKSASDYYAYQLNITDISQNYTLRSYTYTGEFLKLEPDYNVYSFFNKHTRVCKYHYELEYWPPAEKSTFVHVDSQSKIIGYAQGGLQGKKVTINFSPQNHEILYLYVRYPLIRNITNFTPLKYQIKMKKIVDNIEECQKNCHSRNQKWNNQLFQCISETHSHSSNSLNFPLIFGTMFLFSIPIFLIIYKLKSSHSLQIQNPHSQSINLSKIDISIQSICSICLQPQCDVSLECNHTFHQSCIQQWLKKDLTCPYCRQKFGKVKAKAVVA